MSEYQIEALPVEAQQRVLALREARTLLARPAYPEIEISAVDLVTVASWIVTGNDPWESVPTRDQVEIEARAEAFLAPADDEGEGDPEPTPTEARIGDYVDRTGLTLGENGWHRLDGLQEPSPTEAEQRWAAHLQEQEAIARQSTAVTSQVNGQWSPGPLDSTETIPAVPAEPTFDEVLGAPDQADRRAWS